MSALAAFVVTPRPLGGAKPEQRLGELEDSDSAWSSPPLDPPGSATLRGRGPEPAVRWAGGLGRGRLQADPAEQLET
jgi:hypothetical protein